MKLHLRFGMHRDVQLMHEEKNKYDGFVIPAHILAHQAASTSVFVTSLYDRPYIIDPMTFILQNPKLAHISDTGAIRPSVDKLFSSYHPQLIEKILALKDDQTLQPTQYPDLGEFCNNCYNFQTKKVAAEVSDTGAAKYLKRYKKTQPTAPRLVVPPYFCFVNTSTDRFYAMSLKCAQLFQALSKKIPVAPVVLCAPAALKNGGVAKIIEDYAGFPTVLLWMDGFAQGQAQVEDIILVRNLIQNLASKGVKVETLYGGYLMATMWFDGLQALSHGILYTQHKSHTLSPGSGGAPERYYIPGIWEFRSMSQTDIILHQHHDLMCDCAVCAPVLAGNPDNIVKFVDKPDLLRQHFLTVRRSELDEIESSNAKKEAARFMAAHGKYHGSFSALPNPDAMVSNAMIQGLDYLKNWTAGITAGL
jgi:hypothetical protein